MRILVLGGTKFVGRLCAREAVARGYQVTLFNRGSLPGPPGVTTVTGDRLTPEGLALLDALSFDVVIDTWHGHPDAVKRALQVLSGRIHHYIYVSSTGVYTTKDAPRPITEDAPLWDLEDAPTQHCKDKVGGEMSAVRSGVPSALVRAGLILGPGEGRGGRLSTWLRRMERGGPTLAPGPRDWAVQFIDARDLANFVINVAEKKLTGVFNAVSDMNHTTWGEFLDTINRTAGGSARLRWLEPDKISAAGLHPLTELPMWLPSESREIYSVDASKAVAQGMRIRPFDETIRDTWTWLKETSEDDTSLDLGLDPEKEATILKEHFGDVL